jgi:hypothetical protein
MNFRTRVSELSALLGEADSRKGVGRFLSLCLWMGLAFFLVQTSGASVEWVVDAQVANGGKVSGFFTISSTNTLLNWDITVAPGGLFKGTTFITGQTEDTSGGYSFTNPDNGISELILVPPTSSLVGLTGTIQLETGDLGSLSGSLYSEGTGSTGLLEPVRGTVTSVPVPEISPVAMIGMAFVGWIALRRREWASTYGVLGRVIRGISRSREWAL